MNTKHNAIISVIVPVYKVEQYLEQCIESILNQTYCNLEIILVDDGSPDGCPGICDRYAINDTRIKVVHKKNGGLSDARNAGLNIATGEYIGFVDSDDWISPTMYEELIAVASKYDAEIACCGFQYIEDVTGSSFFVKQLGSERETTGPLMLKEIMSQDIENGLVCNKLYIASVFHSVRFPYGQYDEDTAILVQTVGSADRVAYTGTIGYYYRARIGSIMNSGSAALHHRALMNNLQLIETYVRDVHPELQSYYRCFDAWITGLVMKFYLESKDKTEKPTIKQLKHRLGSNLLVYLKSRVRILCKIETLLVYLEIYKPVHDFWVFLRNDFNRLHKKELDAM